MQPLSEDEARLARVELLDTEVRIRTFGPATDAANRAARHAGEAVPGAAVRTGTQPWNAADWREAVVQCASDELASVAGRACASLLRDGYEVTAGAMH